LLSKSGNRTHFFRTFVLEKKHLILRHFFRGQRKKKKSCAKLFREAPGGVSIQERSS
jgi:hypothetical protein